MYIGYLRDRPSLGFSCMKDFHSVEQLLDFANTLKNSFSYRAKKGNETFIFIFSKETVVAIFIFLEPMDLKPIIDYPLFSSFEVYQSRATKLDTSGFLNSSSHIENYIFKSRGGSNELTSEEQEKLVKSILGKAPESNYTQISINKFLKKILKLIDPAISDQQFWRILVELEKPYKFTMIQPTNQSTSLNRPKGFEKVKDDFESRLTKQKILNEHDLKLSQLHAEHHKRVNRFNIMLKFLNPRPSRYVNLYPSYVSLSKSGLPQMNSKGCGRFY